MTGRKAQIGFSQRVRLEWLEQTANMILAGNDKATINKSLQDMLHNRVSIGGQAVRGNREKVITILLKTWLTVPSELKALRDKGLNILQGLPRKDRIAVHWGMALAVYPFWGVVASNTGRLLRLQGSAVASQIQQRVKEQYGERETASRAARRVLRSFIDWGVLSETKEKGIYRQGEQYSIQNPRLVAWMVEAYLHSRVNDSASLKELLDNPGIFPFQLTHIPAAQMVSYSSRLDLLRHSLDEDLIMLKTKVGK